MLQSLHITDLLNRQSMISIKKQQNFATSLIEIAFYINNSSSSIFLATLYYWTLWKIQEILDFWNFADLINSFKYTTQFI